MSTLDHPDHWVRWHEAYTDPDSAISRRLALVQRRLADALAAAPPGPVRLISMCAGQGRDVIPVLSRHSRGGDVAARLVELHPDLAARARAGAAAAGLDRVEVVCGDASTTSAYAGAVPAEVILVCGVFGNISDDDIRQTIEALPELSAPGATVIWTRHRRPPDLTPRIREWWAAAGFEEVGFDTAPPAALSVGTHRLVSPPQPFQPGRALFCFIGDGADAHR